jgi:hypothetical protein
MKYGRDRGRRLAAIQRGPAAQLMFRQVLLSPLGQPLRKGVPEGAQPRKPLAYLAPLVARLLANVESDRLADRLEEIPR